MNETMTDDLAQEIRRIDGRHDMGAGALAEALMPFIAALSSTAAPAPVAGEAVTALAAKWRNRAGDGVFPVGAGRVFADTNRENADELEAALAQDRASQAAEVDALRTELAALKGDTSGFSGANSDDLHVDHFAAAMKGKLTLARSKGRSGWEDREDCPQQRLSDMLRAHVEKGDPIDVANFAMFLHQRGESILASQAGAPVGVEGLPQPFGYVEPRHDLSGYEVFDEPAPRRAAIWNMHGMRKALAQIRAHYSIDADPDGIRARVADAITGALAFGAQGTHKPPSGHWLEPFWDMARAESDAPRSPVVDEATARRLDDYLGGEFDIRIGKQAAHAALVHALAQDLANNKGS